MDEDISEADKVKVTKPEAGELCTREDMDWGLAAERNFAKLEAFLVSLGYGSKAIKRILEG
jgi:hypothetical protein